MTSQKKERKDQLINSPTNFFTWKSNKIKKLFKGKIQSSNHPSHILDGLEDFTVPPNFSQSTRYEILTNCTTAPGFEKCHPSPFLNWRSKTLTSWRLALTTGFPNGVETLEPSRWEIRGDASSEGSWGDTSQLGMLKEMLAVGHKVDVSPAKIHNDNLQKHLFFHIHHLQALIVIW